MSTILIISLLLILLGGGGGYYAHGRYGGAGELSKELEMSFPASDPPSLTSRGAESLDRKLISPTTKSETWNRRRRDCELFGFVLARFLNIPRNF